MTARAVRRHPAAGGYARALLAVGEERGESASYGEELDSLANHVLAEGSAKVFFETPKIPLREKKEALDRALRGKVSDPVLNLVKILVDRGRQELLGQVASIFEELHDEVRGRVHVQITTAFTADRGVETELRALLSRKLNKEIIPMSLTDEKLIGGMTIQIGDTVIDGSVRTRLNTVWDSIASQRLGKDLIE